MKIERKLGGGVGGAGRSLVFSIGLAGGRVSGVLLVKAEGETALRLKVESARKRGRQTRAGGFEEHQDGLDLLFNETFMPTETLRLADFIQVVPIEPNEERKYAAGRNAGGAEIAFSDPWAFQLVVVCFVLGCSENGEEATAVVGGVLGVSGEGGFDFHNGGGAIAVEDEFEESEAGFVVEKVVGVVANEARVELVEDGIEQCDRRRGPFEGSAVELGSGFR